MFKLQVEKVKTNAISDAILWGDASGEFWGALGSLAWLGLAWPGQAEAGPDIRRHAQTGPGKTHAAQPDMEK